MADYLYKDGELKHYGVMGMKWGVRKKQYAKDRVERKNYDKERAMKSHDKRLDKIASKYNKKQDKLKKRYETNRTRLSDLKTFETAYAKSNKRVSSTRYDYAIAKRKAKIDKSYKKTKEYQKIKKQRSRDIADRLIYGKQGRLKVNTLKQSGYTDFGARLMTTIGGRQVTLKEFKRGAKYQDLTKDN